MMKRAQEQQERMEWWWGQVVAARGYEKVRQRAQQAPHLATAHQRA